MQYDEKNRFIKELKHFAIMCRRLDAFPDELKEFALTYEGFSWLDPIVEESDVPNHPGFKHIRIVKFSDIMGGPWMPRREKAWTENLGFFTMTIRNIIEEKSPESIVKAVKLIEAAATTGLFYDFTDTKIQLNAYEIETLNLFLDKFTINIKEL